MLLICYILRITSRNLIVSQGNIHGITNKDKLKHNLYLDAKS